MLYTSFRATIIVAAILGILHMIAEGSFIYIFFPIAIIIWAAYSFFDEDDREYLRRNGIDPDSISWFFPEYADYGAVKDYHKPMNQTSRDKRKTYPARVNDYERYAPQTTYTTYGVNYNQVYKVLRGKCKRNFKITISNDKIEKNDK